MEKDYRLTKFLPIIPESLMDETSVVTLQMTQLLP